MGLVAGVLVIAIDPYGLMLDDRADQIESRVGIPAAAFVEVGVPAEDQYCQHERAEPTGRPIGPGEWHARHYSRLRERRQPRRSIGCAEFVRYSQRSACV